MAELGLAALDAGQRARLSELGYELLSLRSPASRAASDGAASNAAAPVSKRPAAAARLVLDVDSRTLFDGPHAALLRALIVAVGLRESEVSQQPIAGVPTLALGTEAVGGAIRAPTLEQLRNPQAKRALWPVLRGLRRQLQGVGERE